MSSYYEKLCPHQWEALRAWHIFIFMAVITFAGATVFVPATRAQTEIEADPVAFALKGYSLHVGRVVHGKNRLQAGVYGYDLPKFYGGNDQFSRRGNGVTLKYDRFLGSTTRGLFFGADGDFTRTRYTLDATQQKTYRNDFTVGPRIGYRFQIGSHLYITPWFSCGYVFNPGPPVVVGTQKFERNSFGFFPTMHIGWRFRPRHPDLLAQNAP